MGWPNCFHPWPHKEDDQQKWLIDPTSHDFSRWNKLSVKDDAEAWKSLENVLEAVSGLRHKRWGEVRSTAAGKFWEPKGWSTLEHLPDENKIDVARSLVEELKMENNGHMTKEKEEWILGAASCFAARMVAAWKKKYLRSQRVKKEPKTEVRAEGVNTDMLEAENPNPGGSEAGRSTNSTISRSMTTKSSGKGDELKHSIKRQRSANGQPKNVTFAETVDEEVKTRKEPLKLALWQRDFVVQLKGFGDRENAAIVLGMAGLVEEEYHRGHPDNVRTGEISWKKLHKALKDTDEMCKIEGDPDYDERSVVLNWEDPRSHVVQRVRSQLELTLALATLHFYAGTDRESRDIVMRLSVE